MPYLSFNQESNSKQLSYARRIIKVRLVFLILVVQIFKVYLIQIAILLESSGNTDFWTIHIGYWHNKYVKNPINEKFEKLLINNIDSIADFMYIIVIL